MVAIVDVGSNTVRLLVVGPRGEPVREERVYLGLGAQVERDRRIPKAQIAETATVARRFARLARELGAVVVEVIVTAPGRRAANGDTLLAALAGATGWPARVLTAEEEGRLAFAGAVSATDAPPGSVAVCDVGGGSTELLVGSSARGPAWCRSFEIGSIALAVRHLHSDPPSKRMVAAVRGEVRRALDGAEPQLPQTALATGGSARALRRLVGNTLGEEELEEAVRMLRRRSSARIAKTFSLDPLRARTLLAGAVVLAEARSKLGVPFSVARAGLREGAANELLAELAAA
jgi:exopolyphosphatase/guanosine-5'-triphosphate,3'-diphosphate pyrophosphatase